MPEVEISVVVPVYGCVGCLSQLHRRLSDVMGELGVPYELVFVDDRSTDGGWDVLRALRQHDPHIQIVRLSRNFGQHAAITAGLAEAAGAWIAVMDCDLQDRPEDIPRLYAEARAGADIVLTRRARPDQALPRRVASKANNRARRLLLRGDLEDSRPNLSMMSRQVAEEFLRIKDAHRSYQLVLQWLGFSRVSIDVERAERHAGNSSYTPRALIRLALDGLFFEPAVLLPWIVYLGLALSTAGFALAVGFVVSFLIQGSSPGWPTLGAIVLMTGGLVIMCTGVTALYIGKVFEQVKGRPLYVIDERLPADVAVYPSIDHDLGAAVLVDGSGRE